MSASSWGDSVPVASTADIATAAEPHWTLPTRVSFRFLFVYLGLYNIAFLWQIFASEAALELWSKYFALWQRIVQPVAMTVFGVKADVLPNGSGDTTFDYVLIFVYAVIAAFATLVWSVVDRARPSYPLLYAWLRTYVRFGLALAMIGYGVAKIIPLQFGTLRLDRLTQPVGDMSPMGMLWTFMSASVLYTMFTGAGELIAGLLLTARRTALLGALITAGVMANVAMLNFSYDVPVKLYSSHLLFMALFIAAPDALRLARMFVLNQRVEPAKLRPRFDNPRVDTASRVLRTVFVLAVLVMSFSQAITMWNEWKREPNEKAPLYGIWTVDAMRVDGVDRPPLTTDKDRWRRFIVTGKRFAAVDQMDDTRFRYFMTHDEQKKTLTFKQGRDPKRNGTVAYRQPDASTLIFDGTVGGRKFEATLHKAPMPEFLLTNRGFHWINEYPMNR
ncbi:MAG TPA: hypothetical protein VF846_18860 [Thermoanaerobaculia bacterium]|jgi:hypothetical protein